MAFYLKAGRQVTQTFNVKQRLAPEIEAGLPHDVSADIWNLGQIAYQLLCGFKEKAVLAADIPVHDQGNSVWKSQVSNEVKILISSMV